MLSKYMFAELFHNHFVKTITRFVAGGLLVLLLLTAVTPVANAQATSDPFAAVGNVIGNMILTVGASFAKMGGLALDFSTNYLVLGMGDLINSEQLRGAINSLWTVIRDICNLFFIFAFIYIGIKTILDADDANAKRFLAQIIISAFLINFSLFFTKIVIDFSNLTAISVKEAMMPRGTFSENFTQQLGLSGIYSLVDGKALSDLTKGGGIWYSLIATLFLFVSAFVFVAGAVMLVIRFVALIFIMIFSPVYFAAMLFPLTSSYSSKVMSALFSYSFFAPVYFLLLLISMRVVEALNNPLSAGGNLGSAVRATDVTASGSVIVFTIAIIFMIQSLLLAQKLGMVGATSVISGVKKMGGAMTAGAGGALLRSTVGRFGNKMANDKSLLDAAPNSWVKRQQLKLARTAADSSFDARKVRGVGNTLGIGEGRKGGYQTVQKEMTEKEKKFAESLGEVGDDDVRVAARKAEYEHAKKSRKAELEELKKERKAATTPESRLEVQDKIDALEKTEEETKINYEKEKQRRIIGSTYAEPLPGYAVDTNTLKENIDSKEEEIKNAWKAYSALPKASKTKDARETIEKEMENLKSMRKKHKELLLKIPDRGYAGTLEKTKNWKSWIVGRLVEHERKSGEEIRKSAEKGLPKKKED